MSQLKLLFVLLSLIGFSASSFAAVSDVDVTSCTVYSQTETSAETEGGKKPAEEEEEPDCE